MKKTIAVGGHLCLDITPVFPENNTLPFQKLLSPGKLIHMKAATVSTGGAVSNTGLALKRLGAEVSLMGKIGTDEFGRLVENVLTDYGCEKGLIRDASVTTSYTCVIAPPGVDRIFLHHPGANDTFTSDDLNPEQIANASLFHFGYPPLMESTYRNDGVELVKIFRTVQELGTATSLDMAAVDPNSPAGKADWEDILKRVLPYTDFFVPSVEEICFMLDRKRYEDWQVRAAGRDVTEILNLEEDVKPLANRLLEMGAGIVLLKCGAPGVYCCTAGSDRLGNIASKLGVSLAGWENYAGFEPSYVPEAVRSGTGAGDTCIAAFLYSAVLGKTLPRALNICTAAGASCVATYDALSGIPTIEELEAKIDAGWKKASPSI